METTISQETPSSQFLLRLAILNASFALLQAGFNPLQGFNPFALQISRASPRQHRFRQKTVLHLQPLLNGFLQKLVFSLSHDHNLPPTRANRKRKNPAPPKQNGANASIRAVPQFLHWLCNDYFLAAFSFLIGTVAIVCRMRLAIWYGSPWEFGRRSSR